MESKCGSDDCVMCNQVREIVCPDIDPAYARFLEEERTSCMRRRQENGPSRTGPSAITSQGHDQTIADAKVRIAAKCVRSAEVNNKRISICQDYCYRCYCCHSELQNFFCLACTAQEVTAFRPETSSRESLVMECLTLQHEVVAQMRSFRQFHTNFMKIWDEKNNAEAELEKLKKGNQLNTDIVILHDDDEQETTDKKGKKGVVRSPEDVTHNRVKRAREEKITRRGDNA